MTHGIRVKADAFQAVAVPRPVAVSFFLRFDTPIPVGGRVLFLEVDEIGEETGRQRAGKVVTITRTPGDRKARLRVECREGFGP